MRGAAVDHPHRLEDAFFRSLFESDIAGLAVADQKEVRDIAEVRLAIDEASELTLLFDKGHSLDERIVSEQFIA